MIFDKGCGVVEKYIPEAVPLFQEAALIEFPGRAHENESIKKITQEDLDALILPFSKVAVEDSASCVFLMDMEEGQFGTKNCVRRFCDICIPGKNSEEFAHVSGLDQFPDQSQALLDRRDIIQLSFGEIAHMEIIEGRSEYLVTSKIDVIHLIVDGQVEMSIKSNDPIMDTPMMKTAMKGTIGNVITAIEELTIATSRTDLFYLESAPLKPRVPKKGRILRSHDRPMYTLLDPKRIIRQLSSGKVVSSSSATKKQGHPRRSHWRFLRSEKFKNKRGSVIKVPAHWVGPEEAIKGNNRRYRVRLDV